MKEDTQTLLDRANIHDICTWYALGVDMCDWKLFQSIFADNFERDVSAVTGQPPQTMTPEQQVDECRAAMPGFDSTQHILTNEAITIDGNSAKAVVYMTAHHTLTVDEEQKHFVIRGFYVFRFARNSADANWKISAVKLNVLSTEGDAGLIELAHSRASKLTPEQLNKPRFDITA